MRANCLGSNGKGEKEVKGGKEREREIERESERERKGEREGERERVREMQRETARDTERERTRERESKTDDEVERERGSREREDRWAERTMMESHCRCKDGTRARIEYKTPVTLHAMKPPVRKGTV